LILILTFGFDTKEQKMTSIISIQSVREDWEYALKDKQKDIAIAWNHSDTGFIWCSVTNMQKQMKAWRKLAKEDKLKICAYNNKDIDVDGKMWYILIVQPYKDGNIAESNIDPMGVSIFNIMVSGYCCAFKTKENRDMTYKYVMKNIAEPTQI
jgi:hypothetical protein